jgi:chitosanase
MPHIERITDVPEAAVPAVRSRLEQRGASVKVSPQGSTGLFTLEATYPDGSDALAGLGHVGLLATRLEAPPGATAADAPAAPAMLTTTQAQAAKAIVNIFETGTVLGRYDQVTLIPGDTGHLTYGRSQTTLASGLLHDLLSLYVGNPGARFARRLAPYLPRTAARDLSLDHDAGFANLLRACADDLVMRETQDAFFDLAFWRPALESAAKMGMTQPLSVAIVYDGRVHGSWQRLRDETSAADGSLAQLGERAWVQAYVRRRLAWLAQHARADLRATVYRMEAFQRLIDQDRWALALPLVVRGEEISAFTLASDPPGCYAGPVPGTRPLAVASPLLRGLDVRLVQLALSDAGEAVKADGVFGDQSARCLARLQTARGRPATGVADAGLVEDLARAALG